MQTASQKKLGKEPSKKELMELRRRSSDIYGGVEFLQNRVKQITDLKKEKA